MPEGVHTAYKKGSMKMLPFFLVSPEISLIHVMIAQEIVFTRDFLKASRIRD